MSMCQCIAPIHICDDCNRARYVRWLTEAGYLVIAPSDTSPVAELVRAADGYTDQCSDVGTEELCNAAWGVATDPAVRAWVERGRK